MVGAQRTLLGVGSTAMLGLAGVGVLPLDRLPRQPALGNSHPCHSSWLVSSFCSEDVIEHDNGQTCNAAKVPVVSDAQCARDGECRCRVQCIRGFQASLGA
jgi:hypothetical protein